MKKFLTATATLFALAAPAFADSDDAGDPEAGAKDFRKCAACHAIINNDGDVISKGGKAGPNLYGVIGREAGSLDFKYSDLMQAAAAAGLVWDDETLALFLADPTAFLKEISGESGRSKMSKQRVKNPADIVAYLESVAE